MSVAASRNSDFSHEEIVLSISENFGLDVSEAVSYLDEFLSLAIEDHGYFRFDDDQKNEKGDYHPRYHFDFFIKTLLRLR